MADDPAQPARALVTGATGFIGGHLARRLVREGWQVHLLSRPRTQPREAALQSPAITWHDYDGSYDSALAAVQSCRPRVVFHLASLFLAQHQPQDITSLIQSNLLLGTHLLEAMAQSQVHCFINTGTAWQHDGQGNLRAANLYAATKQAFEALIDWYVDMHRLRVVTLKLFDTYGPGDRRRKLIPLLLDSARTGTSLAMSPGEQLIDLVYIDDVIDAFLAADRLLAEATDAGHERYAVSSGRPVSLRQLVATLERVLGRSLGVQFGARPYRPREIMVPWQTGVALPGWTPGVDLEAGLARVLREP
jgi:nucleoside-diphosphate-sugar epimerase